VKAYRESRDKAPNINFSTGWKWLASSSSHFTPKEQPQYPLQTRLGGFQSPSGYGSKEKNPATARN
jgi:hypothetical protein